MKFLSVICRCRDEYYVQEFCDYYLKQGVDSIYILDDESDDMSIYDYIKTPGYSNVYLIKCKRQYEHALTKNNSLNKQDEVNKLYQNIRYSYEWVIYVDIDEFITTKKNLNKTIREELQWVTYHHQNIHWILSPWVMMSGLHNKSNPESVLKSILYRHDQNIKHPYPVEKFKCRYKETYCKSIFKPKFFKYIKDHGPVSKKVIKHNGVDLTDTRLTKYKFKKLRNNDVDTGHFLCYHYRYISLQHALDKLKTNGWYVNDGYTLEDLQATYPEIYDDTMLNK